MTSCCEERIHYSYLIVEETLSKKILDTVLADVLQDEEYFIVDVHVKDSYTIWYSYRFGGGSFEGAFSFLFCDGQVHLNNHKIMPVNQVFDICVPNFMDLKILDIMQTDRKKGRI